MGDEEGMAGDASKLILKGVFKRGGCGGFAVGAVREWTMAC